MIVLIGQSCAGKSTIEKALCKDLEIDRIISYTSRPIRINEIDGIDYHYITDDEFYKKILDGFFAESTTYNGWNYGIAKEDCKDNSIVVVEPFGYRSLKKDKDLNIVSFYIWTEERERVVRMMERGDKVMESFRRIISDQGGFNGVYLEVDYKIDNERGKLNEAINNIKSILKDIRRYNGGTK